MKAFHQVAMELEPDVKWQRAEGIPEYESIDRSLARSAIMNTCLIAFSKNAIAFVVPEPDEGSGVPF